MLMPSRRLFLGGLLSALAAPAIVSAANIMPVRSIIILPKPEFDSFDKLIPDGMQYQWVDTSQICVGLDFSWGLVPASRFHGRFDISGDEVRVGDCVLVERPKVHYIAARGAEIEKAHSLNDQWARKAMADGFSGHVKPITGPTDTFTTVTNFGRG